MEELQDRLKKKQKYPSIMGGIFLSIFKKKQKYPSIMGGIFLSIFK